MTLLGLRNIEAAKQLYERLGGWKLASEVISSYFQVSSILCKIKIHR